MAFITPFIKRMRTQGGTIYTFSSALEDIGLNINERNNIIKLSHFALLNIPSIGIPDSSLQNKFNVLAIPGAYESFIDSGNIKDGRVLIAESFQNYALNLETNILSQSSYNPSLTTTISERIFWKWLKETGAIRWRPIDTSAGTYWQEEYTLDSSEYNSVVKCIGTISAGAVRTSTFGTFNETYVLVPTSFGQTPVYFKQVEDDNYYHGLSITNGETNILGRESYTHPHPDGLDIQAYYDLADSSISVGGYTLQYDNSTGSWTNGWWWTYENFPIYNDNCYFVDTSSYIAEGIYNIGLKYNGANIQFLRSKVDCMSIEFDLNNLKTIFGDDSLTFDSLATTYSINNSFDFNTVLIYYSVYNKSLDKVLATNLFGVMFLDPPSGNTSGWPSTDILLPSITKLQSSISGFGTSYSFRLNIKSDYMIDDTAAEILDESTSAQTALENWSDVFDNLGKTLAILNRHTGTINYITEQYLDIQANQKNILDAISDIEYQLTDIATDIKGTENTIPMFSSGDDPLIDSSIYMKYGRVGIFTPTPKYPVEIDSSVKVKDLIIEKGIYDTSGNLLIGYGSPIQIGSSTRTQEIVFYAGYSSPILNIDASRNLRIYSDVYFDASLLDSNGNPITTGGGSGSQGIQGTQGIQGITGAQGAQGTTGTQGAQGTTGAQGIQGTTGAQGAQGTTGTQGAQGTTGTQGAQGTTGTQGAQGTTGAQGTQGIQGTQGTQGTQGIQGRQGIQGIQGAQGLIGINLWTAEIDGNNNLLFKYNNVTLFKFCIDGSLMAAGDIIGNVTL